VAEYIEKFKSFEWKIVKETKKVKCFHREIMEDDDEFMNVGKIEVFFQAPIDHVVKIINEYQFASSADGHFEGYKRLVESGSPKMQV
jgi:hypothetical protein